jgi:hypothetical protein
MLIGGWDWAYETWNFLDHHFGAWDAWVAIGTLLLAAGTFYMAAGTKRLARLTENEVRAVEDQARAAGAHLQIAQEALEASIRPTLVDVPPTGPTSPERIQYEGWGTDVDRAAAHIEQTSDYLYCSVPLRNVGAGLALVEGVTLRWAANDVPWRGNSSLLAVPVGDQTRVLFSVPARRPEFSRAVEAVQEAGSFTIEASYTDASGRPQPPVRLLFVRNEAGGWATNQVLFIERREGSA